MNTISSLANHDFPNWFKFLVQLYMTYGVPVY